MWITGAKIFIPENIVTSSSLLSADRILFLTENPFLHILVLKANHRVDHETQLINTVYLYSDWFQGDLKTQVVVVVKNLPVNAGDMRCRFSPWVGKIS